MRVVRRMLAVFASLVLMLTCTVSPVMGATGLIIPNQRIEQVAPDYGLKASVSGLEVTLTWSQVPTPPGRRLRGYHVYRSTDENDLLKLSSQITEFAVTELTLDDRVSDGLYYYAVQATYSDGSRAPASRMIMVNATDMAGVEGLPIPAGPSNQIPVHFVPIAERITDADKSTIFDLNRDSVGDISIANGIVTAKNGAKVQIVDPLAHDLDQVNYVPVDGYTDSAPTRLSCVYVVKLSSYEYAKFMLLQITPKVSLCFHPGTQTQSILRVDDQGGRVVLNWDAMDLAELGYLVHRYEILENNDYIYQPLCDFYVQETTFTDISVETNHYYLYTVSAIPSGVIGGPQTTVIPVRARSGQRTMTVFLSGNASLNGMPVTLAATPVTINGIVMVPASLFSLAGVKVAYEPSTGEIALTINNRTVGMTVGATGYTVNRVPYKMVFPAYLSGGEIMVQLTHTAWGLGFEYSFDSTDRSATVTWVQ